MGEPSKFLVDNIGQSRIDSLRSIRLKEGSFKIYPFNPNFITDYKGYTLGITPDELDRLYAFRKKGEYVNSAKEFQRVTQISDSLLEIISPYFKFPKWKNTSKFSKSQSQNYTAKEAKIQDLNSVSAEDLKTIYGIGDKLSARIIKFRDRLGGFLVDEQLYDVYGLESEVVQRTLTRFRVLNPPKINKVNVNTATVEELSRLIYINQSLAQEIVAHREMSGTFQSLEELMEIKAIPQERIGRIKLYLTL